MTELDHLLWAVPDLQAGTEALGAVLGVTPARGGSHPGFGTRNSLLSLGDSYLEVIAPDPEQPLEGTRGAALAALARPGLLTFAVRTGDLSRYADVARAAGLAVGEPTPMSRRRPDGVQLAWTVLNIQHPVYGDLVPFAIDWQGSPHPTATAPAGCRLLEFTLLHPEPGPLESLLAALAVPVRVMRAGKPGLMASLETPAGPVLLIGP